MKGSIIKRKRRDGSIAYTAIYRDLHGKQIWTAFDRQKDAAAFLAGQIVAVHERTHVTVKPVPLGIVFDAWTRDQVDTRGRMGTVKPSTAKSYKSVVAAHLRPTFGAIRSDRLGRDHVQAWVGRCAASIAEGDLAPKTFNNVLNLFSAILVWARRQSYLKHDPLDGMARLPRVKSERAFLEPAQLDRLLGAAATRPPADMLIKMAAYTGARRGELFALQWDDLDWGDGQEGGQIAIRRSVYQGDVTSPKTAAGIRRVDVPAFLLEDLRLYQAMYPAAPGDRIFRSSKGGAIDPDNWTEHTLRPILQAAGLPGIGLHTLRHTYASLLINQNESIKYVSKQLGHASISITADLYGHLFKETSVAAMRRLGADTAARRQVARPANGALTGPDEPVKPEEWAAL